MMNIHKPVHAGFTLIESMVAVTILTLSIAGPLFIASRAIVAAQNARDQLTASYLAQEGIEYVRMMRDNEFLTAFHLGGTTVSDTAWTNFLTGTMPSHPGAITVCRGATCLLDPTLAMGAGSGFSIQSCSGVTCTPLYLSAGKYTQQAGGTKTAFTRTINATDIPPNEELITSTVSWVFHNVQYSVTTNDHLTPWQ